jgi:antitoxin (DNA-binding transcriptional repressor) of toxin-antitoxin stability system
MRSISVRDLRSKSAQIWRELTKEKDLIVRSKGKPIAILSTTTEEALEESISTLRRARAIQGLLAMQLKSTQSGKDRLPLEVINKEISAVRKARREG